MSISRISQPKSSSPTYIGINIGPRSITGEQIAEQTIAEDNMGQNSISEPKIQDGSVTGSHIQGETITGHNIDELDIVGKTINADTGSIGGWELGETELEGPAGAIIRSGQTDFAVGTGFWLGNVQGTPKFSIGSALGNKMEWDGTNLRVTGSFTPTTVFNTYSYTTANLPIPPTSVGFSNPTAVE